MRGWSCGAGVVGPQTRPGGDFWERAEEGRRRALSQPRAVSGPAQRFPPRRAVVSTPSAAFCPGGGLIKNKSPASS